MTQPSLAADSSSLAESPRDRLHEAVAALHVSLGSPEEKGIPSALEHGADLSALALMAEWHTDQEEDRLWEQAQGSANPSQAYMESVQEKAKEAHSELSETLGLLQNQTTSKTPLDIAANLALAAHVAVQSESDFRLALRYLGGSVTPNSLATEHGRYTVLLPAVQSLHHAAVAKALLSPPPAARHDESLDTRSLEEQIPVMPNAREIWPMERHGPFHDLARYVRLYSLDQPNATLDDLTIATERLAERPSELRPDDPAIPLIKTIHADSSWWLERAPVDSDGAWGPVLTFLRSQAIGALHEQELLEEAQSSGFPWRFVLAGSTAIVALTVAILLYRKGRRPPGVKALGILMACTFLIATPFSVVAHGNDGHEPRDDGEEPVVVPLPSEPERLTVPTAGGLGNLAQSPDGRFHFVWTGCTTPEPSTGCWDVMYRDYNPSNDEWGPINLVADRTRNTTLPRVAIMGSQVHLTWLEGDSTTPGEARELHHCMLQSQACGPITRLSSAGEYTVISEMAADAGHLVVVWHEEYEDDSRIVARWLEPGSWGEPQQISQAGRLARYPDVALDTNGDAHLTWQGGLGDAGAGVGREITYAKTSTDGILEPAATATLEGYPQTNSKPSIAVRPDQVIGIAYNGWKDIYFLEKPPGEEAFQDPINISRMGKTGAWPDISAAGSDWVLNWVTGSVTNMHIWRATSQDDFWTRPKIVVGDPYGNLILIPRALVTTQGIHQVWTGTESEDPRGQREMYFLTWPFSEQEHIPPSFSHVWPPEGAWIQGPEFQLEAMVESDSPLSDAGTQWILDGSPVETHISDHGMVTAHANTTDGTHSATLRVEDSQGSTAEATVSFHVDSVPPELDVDLLASGMEIPLVDGWHAEPLRLQATSDPGSGAPSNVQVDLIASGRWQLYPDQALELPEGALIDIRFRALDAAGNVQLGAPIQVGWDQTPPNINVTLPRWINGPTEATLFETASQGSPVDIHLWTEKTGVEVANGTVSAGKPSTIMIQNLPPGDHTVLGEAVDQAENRQEIGPWTIGFDNQDPTVEVTEAGILVRDEGASGLASIVLDNQQIHIENASSPVTIPLDELESSTIRVVAIDYAQNRLEAEIDLSTQQIQSVPTDEANPIDESASESNVETPMPATSLLVVCIASLVLARVHRDH